MTTPLQIAAEVASALRAGSGVVALETTLIAHGFPAGEGALVGEAS
jgi:pseudouridine-5'-phosphate glycosidase